jgi:hypothetical protein
MEQKTAGIPWMTATRPECWSVQIQSTSLQSLFVWFINLPHIAEFVPFNKLCDDRRIPRVRELVEMH